jgi:hypothetical protein
MMSGSVVRDFITELYIATEGAPPEPALLDGIPDVVSLIELRR